MGIYGKFETDETLETEGILLDYGDGVKIRIARAGGSNRACVKAFERVHRKFRRQIQLETLSDEIGARLLREVYADTVVLGWEGVEDRDGNPLAFSRENCLKVLEDLPDLFRDIREAAENAALFRAELRETDAKN